ncbi:MAG TPA: WG repeat-containing protein, partial [Spirochaetota bacterium]|nr:WG repeat-containing protein [Spirochaetota bacterium]
MIHKLKLLLLTVIMVCFVDIVFSQNNDVIWIIQPQFDWADDFHEGMARVKKNGKLGYINKEGTLIIQPQFDWAWDFHEGMAR